jgi:hypothetical protein
MRGAPPKQILRAHLPDQRAQFNLESRAPSTPPRFPTPIAAKAGPCQLTSVSGWTIVTTFKIDGKHRYIWTKNQRSLFVSRARPFSLRRKTIN